MTTKVPASIRRIMSPIRIGGVEVRNRVVRAAHGTKLASYSFDDFFEFQAARARGGVGLTILEIMGVHRSSPSSLKPWDPAHADGYRRTMDRLRPLGMTVFQQLWHGGAHIAPEDGSPSWSCSDIPSPHVHTVPIAMTKDMIDEVVGGFAEAARISEDWGAQGIELHAAHGYLPQQFLSANTNHREDDYGGSFENRIRFVVEVMQAMRGAVSPGFPVGIRLGPDDTPGGFGVEENIRLVKVLEDRKLTDFVDISMGSYQSGDRITAGMFEQVGYELPATAPISRSTTLPTIVTGRFRTLEEADQVIRQGDADMVSLTRAHIADPDIVRKTLEGKAEQVRPCIACNQGCVGGVRATPPRVACAVNPAAGFERTVGEDKLPPAERRKTVLVVGGGPAGMEAARIAALRGHAVTLAEATTRLGGAIALAAKAPARHGISDITVWQEAEIFRLGVSVRLSTYMEIDDILEEGADCVVIATGSMPRMDGFQSTHPGEPILGMEQPHVQSSYDLLEGGVGPGAGRSAVLIDDTGHYEGIAAAEFLHSHGWKVHFVTRHVAFAPLLQAIKQNEDALRRMEGDRLEVHLRSRTLEITRNSVTIAPNHWPNEAPHRRELEAALVVVITPNRGNRPLYDELKAKGVDVHIAGDANSPRYLLTAIKEGWAVGARI